MIPYGGLLEDKCRLLTKNTWSKTLTIKTIPSRWNDFACSPLEGKIPCLEFTIEIESINLMYNPNTEIRDREYPIKIGKFSVKYYTF